MDLIKLENDLYEIIFILSEYLSEESAQYIKSEIIRSPLKQANDILFQFVEKLDRVIEQNDSIQDMNRSKEQASSVHS